MLTDPQRNTILAALRFYQQQGLSAAGAPLQALATDDGAHAPLSADDIDALCEQMNSEPETLRLAVHLEGGAVYSVFAETEVGRPVRVYVVDYDTQGVDEEDLVGITQADGLVEKAHISSHKPFHGDLISFSEIIGDTVAERADA